MLSPTIIDPGIASRIASTITNWLAIFGDSVTNSTRAAASVSAVRFAPSALRASTIGSRASSAKLASAQTRTVAACRNDNALALADGRDVFFADPFAEGDFSDADFADPMHFSRAGAEKFSRRIAEVAVRIRTVDPALPAANIRP